MSENSLRLLPHERAALEAKGLIRPYTDAEIADRVAAMDAVPGAHPRNTAELVRWLELGRCPAGKYLTTREISDQYRLPFLRTSSTLRDLAVVPVGNSIYLAKEVAKALAGRKARS